MMKLLLATMMIVCGLIGPANADQLPKEFVGKYCGLGPYLRDEENRCFNTKGEITRDDGLEIKPDSYTRWEAGCNFDSIKVRWDPTIPPATKTPPGEWHGDHVAYIIASCEGEGGQWRERIKIYSSKGYLYFENKEIKRSRIRSRQKKRPA